MTEPVNDVVVQQEEPQPFVSISNEQSGIYVPIYRAPSPTPTPTPYQPVTISNENAGVFISPHNNENSKVHHPAPDYSQEYYQNQLNNYIYRLERAKELGNSLEIDRINLQMSDYKSTLNPIQPNQTYVYQKYLDIINDGSKFE